MNKLTPAGAADSRSIIVKHYCGTIDSNHMPEAKRILIVDDDPDIHQLLGLALRDSGRAIESAYDGFEGLRKFEAARWDLVITDVIMPGMDGLELLERIRRTRPETPVVVMTVDSTAEKIVSAIRDKAFSWFRKPFTTADVQSMVDSALAGPISRRTTSRSFRPVRAGWNCAYAAISKRPREPFISSGRWIRICPTPSVRISPRPSVRSCLTPSNMEAAVTPTFM